MFDWSQSNMMDAFHIRRTVTSPHREYLLRHVPPKRDVVLVRVDEVMVESIVATLFFEHQALQCK